MNAQWLC